MPFTGLVSCGLNSLASGQGGTQRARIDTQNGWEGSRKRQNEGTLSYHVGPFQISLLGRRDFP